MTDRADPSAGPSPDTVGDALRRAWRSSGGLLGLVVVGAAPVGFVVVSALAGLVAGLVVGGVAALAAFAVRLARREPLRGALGGLAVTVACALVAALTGQARDFFLLPMMLPVALLLVCGASVVVRRPLTGVLLNRPAGGPHDWYRHPRLMRVHVLSTLAAVAVNLVNATLQIVFYVADRPAVLAVAHVATGPVFAALVAVTLVAARRCLGSPAPLTASPAVAPRAPEA